MDATGTSAAASPRLAWLGRLTTSRFVWGWFLLFGLAAVVRQYLFAHSYWYDEAFLILTIRERGFVELLGAQPYNLVIPPLFLWIERALHVIGGDGEMVLRLPAFAAAVASLFLMIPLARVVLPRQLALWPFALLAVSRHLVAHACEVRPYTIDLLFSEFILFCAAVRIAPAASDRARRLAMAGLVLAAAMGPWASFPTMFVLGGTSLALAVHSWRRGDRRTWIAWLLFNGSAALSGLALWWFSAREMYYPGMVEHWGHQGWWGFPDWHSPANVARWLLSRPYEVGNYGNREVGIVLAALALVGAGALTKRAPAMAVLLMAPFVLAVGAALAGKYPLAHRTGFFLLPFLWLLAATGFGVLLGDRKSVV